MPAKMDNKKLAESVRLHGLWLQDNDGGKRADLHEANLSGADLSWANLRGADLRGANLREADLREADLRGANLSGANLRRAELRGANLRRADLRGADLRGANLREADLSEANLSGAKGLLSPTQYLADSFEATNDGIIVYKTFGATFQPPSAWKIEPGSVLTEVCNPCRVSDCASGINVAKRDWNFGDGPLWCCLIRWPWLAGVVVPYHTDGKIRCERLELIKIVEDQ